MSKQELTGKHILLLLLYSPGKTQEDNEPIVGRTRIIKMMFLFKEKVKKDFLKNSDIELISFPEFFAWNYGPFSKDVYDDIEFFINNDFIKNRFTDLEMTESELKEYENWIEEFSFEDEKDLITNIPFNESFKLTPRGMDFIKKIISEKLQDNQMEILKKFKKEINSVSLKAIMRYTYLKYPDFADKSKIKDHVLG